MKRYPFFVEEVQGYAIQYKNRIKWLRPVAPLEKLTFGKSLKIIRKRRKISLRGISDLSGVQVATLSRMESNKMVGTLKNYMNIARAMGLKLSELIKELEN